MTPDELKALIASYLVPFDTLPRHNEETIRNAALQLSVDDRTTLSNQMHVLLVIASKIKAMLRNDDTDLLGPAADSAQIMNLLCAADPDRLSADVIDRLMEEMPSFSALPRKLMEAISARIDERDAAHEELESMRQRRVTTTVVPPQGRTRH